MKAGYLVGKWVAKKLNSMGKGAIITWLAKSVGKSAASKIVNKVVTCGATAAAEYIALILGAEGTLAGPIGTIVGAATGWL